MSNYIDKVKKWAEYNEPKEKNSFELLETEDEGNSSQKDSKDGDNKQESSRDKASDNRNNTEHPSKRNKTRVHPLSKELKGSNADNNDAQEEKPEEDRKEKAEVKLVSLSIDNNKELLKKEFHASLNESLIIREFMIARSIRVFLVFIDGMADGKVINEFILGKLMDTQNFLDLNEKYPVEYVINNVISVNRISREVNFDNIIREVLMGSTALFIDNCPECIVMDTKGFEKRSVGKPITETVVRGSQEGFTENLETNLSLLRRIIKNKNLIAEIVPVGKTDNSSCAVVYIKSISNDGIVQEVKRRLNSLDVDFLMGDGVVEQLLEDHPFMLLPQVINTERPDRVCSFLMEGKVAIISEGAPFADVVPISFFHLFHTSEDYNLRWQYGTFIRLVRLVAFLLALYLPSAYVALTLYHQEMIPTELLTSIAQSRESVPFPLIVEILLMEISFELIREAGIRVPGVLGQTIGIIGALILGQAAVAAGLVSPILIIILAVTGLGNFTVPNYSLALGLRIIRFIYIVMAAIAGLYGIVVGTFVTGCLVLSLKSFGMPYFAPIAPKTEANYDIIMRAPLWKLQKKPDALNVKMKNSNKDPREWANKDTGDDKG